MSTEYLLMQLETEMPSFGGVALDESRPSEDFPGLSMITGILAGALGWSHRKADEIQRLQERISYAVRCEATARGGNAPLMDLQNATLGSKDEAWTTQGIPERRAGDARTYDFPNRKFNEYRTDMRAVVALTLSDPYEKPTVQDLRQALNYPSRPLFIGRKHALPNSMLCIGIERASSSTEALSRVPSMSREEEDPVQWDGPDFHESVMATHQTLTPDIRDWRNMIHTGRRTVNRGAQTKRRWQGAQRPEDSQ